MELIKLETPDEKEIVAHYWAAEDPIGQLVIVHGHGEHSLRFTHVAEWYVARGFAIWAMDLRGHGKTEGARGTARYTSLLDDIEIWLAHAYKHAPNLPLYLYGHSMGGQLVISYLISRELEHLHGVIATAPWIKLTIRPQPSQIWLGRIARYLAPDFTQNTGLNAAFISRNDDVVRQYIADPLVHDLLSADLGMSLIIAGTQLAEMEEDIKRPLLILHGNGDKITSHDASAAFAAASTGDVTFRSFPGLYHEIHNEPEQEQVFEYILLWLLRHLQSQDGH